MESLIVYYSKFSLKKNHYESLTHAIIQLCCVKNFVFRHKHTSIFNIATSTIVQWVIDYVNEHIPFCIKFVFISGKVSDTMQILH